MRCVVCKKTNTNMLHYLYHPCQSTQFFSRIMRCTYLYSFPFRILWLQVTHKRWLIISLLLMAWLLCLCSVKGRTVFLKEGDTKCLNIEFVFYLRRDVMWCVMSFSSFKLSWAVLWVVNTFKCQNDPLNPTPKYVANSLAVFFVFFYMPSRASRQFVHYYYQFNLTGRRSLV